ncbi:E3 ubiquitin-protein ligase UHRF1 [Armadillidium vulgare]|nr:E3 ubiquitin-protein ligase UHRF1 [Armadillidium vulgare]
MEDGHTIFDYGVNINDVIQLMVKPVLNEMTNQTKGKESKNKPSTSNQLISNKENVADSEPKEATSTASSAPSKSQYYLVGDLVDAKSLYDGAWWEGKITKIGPNLKNRTQSEADDGLFYYIKFERYSDLPEDELKLEHIRPRARTKLPLEKIKPKQLVMVNYNFENPEERGFWYDCEVSKVINTRSQKILIGTIISNGNNRIEGCHINLISEIFKIESHIPLQERNGANSVNLDNAVKRQSGPSCKTCKDNPKRKCKDCGCCKCGGKENPEKQLMYCPACKTDDSEIVKAGEKLKESRKKARMASSKNSNTSSRDWGKGFACAGRQKVCSIVPQDHFGPIPGVEVGTLWKFRLQVSEAGVHRPHVAGIHGRENSGAYSIVLAGGYEDDEDRGEEFTYTGSGGRDLSGNKRTAEQSCDQILTRMNKYDGIYKIVRYWQAPGKSGFKVWRYLLRRDDPSPPPWTYPEGYLEAMKEKEIGLNEELSEEEEEKPKKRGRKRKKREEEENDSSDSSQSRIPSKREKIAFELEKDILHHINRDECNAKTWEECKSLLSDGKSLLLKEICSYFIKRLDFIGILLFKFTIFVTVN